MTRAAPAGARDIIAFLEAHDQMGLADDLRAILARLAPPTRGENLQAAKNIIEVWLRVNDLRGSPPPITWAHLQDLAEAFASLLDSVQRDALARLAPPTPPQVVDRDLPFADEPAEDTGPPDEPDDVLGKLSVAPPSVRPASLLVPREELEAIMWALKTCGETKLSARLAALLAAPPAGEPADP